MKQQELKIKSSLPDTKVQFDGKMKLLTMNDIENLLKKKIKIGYWATSTVYKIINCFSKSGFLTLKILNDALFKPEEEESVGKEEIEGAWGDDDDFEEENLQLDMNIIKKSSKV